MSILVPPIGWKTGKSLTLEYVGTPAPDAVNRSSYTFTGVDIGSPSADRLVIVAASGATTSNRQAASVSIEGSAATIHANPSNNGPCASLSSRVVTSGSAATIAVTFNATVDSCSIHVYTLKGYASATPYAVASGANDAASISTTLNVPLGGVGVVFTSSLTDFDFGTLTNWVADREVKSSEVGGERFGRNIVGKTILDGGPTQLTTVVRPPSNNNARNSIAAVSWL